MEAGHRELRETADRDHGELHFDFEKFNEFRCEHDHHGEHAEDEAVQQNDPFQHLW